MEELLVMIVFDPQRLLASSLIVLVDIVHERSATSVCYRIDFFVTNKFGCIFGFAIRESCEYAVPKDETSQG